MTSSKSLLFVLRSDELVDKRVDHFLSEISLELVLRGAWPFWRKSLVAFEDSCFIFFILIAE